MGFIALFLNYKHFELKLRGVSVGHTVTTCMVTYRVTKMTTFSLMN